MFGERLKKLRIEKGLSVKEVAEKIEVPLSTYRSWEEGSQIVGEAPYLLLSKVYGTSLFYLIIGTKEEFCLTSESSEKLKNKLLSVKNTLNEVEEIITSVN